VRIDLAPFTLVGATTRAGLLGTPLRDRFGIPVRLDFYSPEDLITIVLNAGKKLGAPLTADGALEIAKRARGTPRVAVRLLRRVRDFADAADGLIDAKLADAALKRLEVDSDGLDMLDRRYLKALVETYGGGPVGVETLAAALAEARDSVEDVIEPYLMQQGFVMRTPRGRCAAPRAYERLGKKAPPIQPQTGTLFGEE
jgi:Holliday junction DNA helicase RuvB